VAIPSRTRNRSAQADRTRTRRAAIVAAAGRLFVRDGYLQTTMAEIAKEAGVAVQTLYLSFGSKVDLLAAALDVSLAGDDDPRPVLQRPSFTQLPDEPQARRALEIFAEAAAEVINRVYPLYATIRAASADPEVADVLERNKRLRLDSFQEVMAQIASKAGFRSDLPTQRAAQILYTVISEETYGLLVVEQGWPVADWTAWAVRAVAAEILQ
jgi:AcrR family transcriptional regulator